MSKNRLIGFFVPLLFVLLWSTGFIGAKYGLIAAEPFTFLMIRHAIAAALLLCAIPFLNVRWPRNPIDFVHISVVGILMHSLYLGGVFAAIYRGVDSGISAIIVGLQPLLTVVFSMLWLGERISKLKVGGTLLGFAGISVIIAERGVGVDGLSLSGLALCGLALLGISIGTIYQKKFCTSFDLLPSVCMQYIASALFLLALSLIFEYRDIYWSTRFILAMTWLVAVLSLGAVVLLMWLIRMGEAGKVASLFYLVPPAVALEAWILFDERLSMIAIGGMMLCVVGVAMVINSPTAITEKN